MFSDMKQYLKPVTGEDFEISYREITESQLILARCRDMMNRRREYVGQKPGIITQLHGHGELIMSDTEMERRTNRFFLTMAEGDVLIGGLGLGMVLLAVQDKESIKSVTVVEKYQEVIDLVVPQLPLNGKVAIICGDVFEWYPEKDVKYDTIYFDIWNYVCGDHYEDMKKLHRRYGKKLNHDNPNSWMSCWRYKDTRAAA